MKRLDIFVVTSTLLLGALVSCHEKRQNLSNPTVPSNTTHRFFTVPPKTCTNQGAPIENDNFTLNYQHLNCSEECIVAHPTLPECTNLRYISVNNLRELDAGEASVGGYVFQGSVEQPCSLRGLPCCNPCTAYLTLVDFEDKDNWKECRRILFPAEATSAPSLFSMDEPHKCCVLDGFMVKAIVKGKIHVEDGFWSFSEVHSICRLP